MVSILSQNDRKRLIVLLPESLAGNLELTKKIYWMGLKNQYRIMYLILVDEPENKLTVSRIMATMRIQSSDNWMLVSSILIETRAWLKTLKEIYEPGDILVCQEEQTVRTGFFEATPIVDFLNETLHAQIIILTGFYSPQRIQINRWLKALVFWLGCLFLLAGFFAFGIQVDQQSAGFTRTVLGLLGVVIEIGAVWAWTNFTRR